MQCSLVQVQVRQMQAVVAGGRRARALRLRRFAEQTQREKLASPIQPYIWVIYTGKITIIRLKRETDSRFLHQSINELRTYSIADHRHFRPLEWKYFYGILPLPWLSREFISLISNSLRQHCPTLKWCLNRECDYKLNSHTDIHRDSLQLFVGYINICAMQWSNPRRKPIAEVLHGNSSM